MRTSISNANMCQPGADYVCDWKPLDNALHASSFLHLVVYIIYIYVKTRRDELARITGKWMQWDFLGGTCCWPDSVYIHFFFSLFFCRMRIEFLSISPFFFFSLSLLTGDSISLSSSFQLSKWTNQSLLTSLFFSSRAFTESFVFSRLGRFFFFLLLFLYSVLSYCTNLSFGVFFLLLLSSVVSSFLDVTHLATKKTRASANAVDERPERTRE